MHIRIAIADDHPMVIRGIQNMLLDYPHIAIEDVYINGDELKKGIERRQPDVLLLDLNMPIINGDELLPVIVKKYPCVNVLVLTNIDKAFQIAQVLSMGALGYLLKSTEQSILVAAIDSVYMGKQFVDASLKELLSETMSKAKKKNLLPTISKREKEILQLILQEHTNQEIADQLFLSFRTVETYRLSLMAKMNVRNTAGLVKMAIELGLGK